MLLRLRQGGPGAPTKLGTLTGSVRTSCNDSKEEEWSRDEEKEEVQKDGENSGHYIKLGMVLFIKLSLDCPLITWSL